MTQLCSADSWAREEPLTATASRVERWLLVEHRGAWGPQSVPSSRLPAALARSLAQAAAAADARLLMLRRPAGVASGPGRRVFAVDSRPGHERVLARSVPDDAELLHLGWDGGPEWHPYDGPLYLVCTHGRHDRCCALRGRPVAQALSRRHPDRTWECSHIGGDRFAANLVVLPQGLYLGRLTAEDVVRVVEDLTAGLLPAGQVRGHCGLPLPVQAAQAFARESLGRWGTGDLRPVEQTAAGAEVWRVRLAPPDGEVPGVELPGVELPGVELPDVELPDVELPDVEVVVRYDRRGDGARHLLTCDAEQAKVVPVFRLVSLTAVQS